MVALKIANAKSLRWGFCKCFRNKKPM